MKQSITRQLKQIPHSLIDADLPLVLKRVYANRGIQGLADIDYGLERLLSFANFKDIDRAADVIYEVIRSDRKIIIVGDYDVDGATSTALILRALKKFGFSNIDYVVPSRFEYGYGLTPEIVEIIKEKHPDLIITVDNGISSHEGVDRAKKNGIKVVITDHHLAADTLPSADAIVNPNQPGCSFESKVIAGVGVAFYTMLALRSRLKSEGWFRAESEIPNMADLLDLVALGTVADVVPLDKNNRLLVEQGLRRIRSGRCCYGIRALLSVSGRSFSSCVSSDLAFYVGPRLNAAGRLEDMSAGIACLLSDDVASAESFARELHELNGQRREIESEMIESANSQLEDIDIDDDSVPYGFCLYDERWHQGVVGLLASRVKEKYHRPVIAFAEDGDNLKGSARSISGLHIRDLIDLIDKSKPGLIEKFGGHAMAAGLTIKKEKFSRFSEQFHSMLASHVTEDILDVTVCTDGGLSGDELSLEIAELIRYAGPWGQRFSEPLFDDMFEVKSWRILADKHLKMNLRHIESGADIEAIAFNNTGDSLLSSSERVRLAYRLSINEYKGRRQSQLIVQSIEAVD